VMGLMGLALGITFGKRFLVLPAVVSTMLVVHATHGWYPLLPLFRRVGVRTRNEIDRERYALKALRGDFAALPSADSPAGDRASAAWRAACK
jgi:hypothetical protein